MREPNLFVFELVPVDALASSAVLVRDVSTLSHEAFNNSVEDVVFICEPFFASADRSEILRSLGHLLCKQFENNSLLFSAFNL